MKDFFKTMLIDPFEDGFLGGVVAILCWILFAIIGFAIFYGIFYLADSSYLPESNATGIVTEKYYNPPSTSTYYVHSDNLLIPVNSTIPESYSINIKIGSDNDNFCLNYSDWQQIQKGDTLDCTFKTGRFSGNIYITSINKHNE